MPEVSACCKKISRVFIIPTLVIILSLCIPGCYNRAKAPEFLRVIFTSDTQGYFTPCGCAGGPRGGMARRATVISQARTDAPGPVVVIETGNFSTGFASDLERTKAEYVLRAMVQMNYDAVTIGNMDVRRPRLGVIQYAQETGVPLTSAGYTYIDESTGTRTFSYTDRIIVERGEFRIGIVGHPLDDLDPEKLGIENIPDVPAQELYMKLQNIFDTQNIQFLILASDLSIDPENARFIANQFPIASLIIAGESADADYVDEKSSDEIVRPVLIPRAASWGRSVGILDLELTPTGGISAYHLRYVDLNDEIPDDPSMDSLRADYLEALDDRPAMTTEIRITGYVGSDSCMECHGGQFEHWSETRHASAWQTLEEMGKLDEATCIPCHSTGYSTTESIPSRLVPMSARNVGCESCHGPGQIHIDYQTWKIYGELTGQQRDTDLLDPVILTPPEETCVQCHVPPNDEAWTYNLKLNRIRHE